ncbi:hypothetical protein AMS68_003623 [Peltaster fructicola]|uniref:Bul1 N-terminal domain-containing protein n=1 Tax=Peltaster fructicola TaxID=286661 RepID=A0A6H0XTV6_9PEZI|nr:hypothetical protein AMS68_003623 [Peltaster fructicola]
MATKLLTGLVSPKTDIRISLDSKRKVYSTLDRIQGSVTFTPSADLPFDDIDIEFVGTSRTYVERLSTAAAISGRSQAFHQFLRLSQPGVAEHYPGDRILKAGQSYKISFVFAVPRQLLPRVCTHTILNDAIREAHLQLPPSLGDCEASNKSEQLDDFAPDMASIRYGVYAKISTVKPGQSQRTTIVAKARKVRIIPAVDELPPVNVEGNSDITMRKEKKLRKGLLKGKLGTLVMEAAQPASFKLPAPDAESGDRITTMATVLLRFDPQESNAQPPKLNNLTSKLKVTTFFSTAARRDFPNRTDCLNELSNGFHSETLEVSSRCMANVEWTKMDAERDVSPDPWALPRRTSSAVSAPLLPPDASSSYTGGAFYIARLLVPIELPSNKCFVPTFHSCLVSRVYTLGLSLSTNTAFGGNMDLRVPVQISALPSLRNDSPRPSITSLNSVEIDDESADGVDEFFEPRTIYAPEDEYLGSSRLQGGAVEPQASRRDSVMHDQGNGLPEYSLLAPGSRGRRPGVPVF